jgi:hypothetical protein
MWSELSRFLLVLSLGLGGLIPIRAETVQLVAPGSPWQYFKGFQDPHPDDPAAWRQIDFDDSEWLKGTDPFFYGEPLEGTALNDMQGGYSTVFLRTAFDVVSPENLGSLSLKVLSDDGFVAWINGQEIARFNVPDGDLRFWSVSNGALSEPLSVETYTIANPSQVLRPGRNVLAILGLNSSISSSSDFVLQAALEGEIDNSPPAVERVLPTPGAVVRSLKSVEIQFSRRVQGLEAADLQANGMAATSVQEVSPGQFLFLLPPLTAGAVTVEFRPDHGITDLAVPPHAFAGGSWTFTVDPTAPAPGVVVNEIMASNNRTLRDEDGDSPDWIELFNSGDTPVSLAGWYLSDDLQNLKKWQLPAANLEPHGFLVVFASGKNRAADPERLHTSFRLSANAGGALVLADAAGQLVSALTNYPAQITDVSYGRAPGALNLQGFFTQPTPGKGNAAYGPGFSPEVQFSESSRTYRGEITITLSTTPPGAVIRYTTNGALPEATSPIYTAPLRLVANTVQIRARSFTEGLLPGAVRSETFVPLSDGVATFTSDLPVLLIHHFDQGRPGANTKTFAHVQIFEPDTNGVTSLTNAPALTSRAVIAARGSSTEGYAKVSMKLEFQDEFGLGRALGPLGLPEDPDWVLYAPNNFEPILIHNPYAHRLSREIGRYSPRTRFVEVYFAQRGFGPVPTANYHGIYVLDEKIKFDRNRVNEPKLVAGQNAADQITGGYLMKIDRPDPGDSGFFGGGQWILYVTPKEEEITLPERAPQRNYLQQYMNQFGNALYGSNYRNPTNGYRAYIDVGTWIDHHLLNVLTFNVDALRLSAYFYKSRHGPLRFGPLWDFDRALYSTDGRDSNPRTWRSQTGDLGTDFFNYTWWDRLFSDPDFYQDYIDRYQDLRRGAFSDTNLWRLVDDLTGEVIRAQPREQAKWGILPRGGYSGEISRLKNWLTNRVNFMDSQFVQPPGISHRGQAVPAGFRVELTPSSQGSIYYTLDGTDPRRRGGATGDEIAPGARLYTGPIEIPANARLVARARNPAHVARTGPNNPPLRSIWSRPVAETFVVTPFPVRLTEIMYHPVGDGSASAFLDEDFEFIELHNAGTTPVDLTGFQLEGTVEFTFTETNAVRTLPPGGRLLLVETPEAFALRYPGVGPVAGKYTGRLNNDRGRLALFGPLREPVFEVRYEETWDPITDGGGPSLVLREEAGDGLDSALASSWRASDLPLGSPGIADPAPLRLSAQMAGDVFQVRLRGQPGQSYRLESIPALYQNWQPVETRIAAADGSVVFQVLPALEQRWFRVVGP